MDDSKGLKPLRLRVSIPEAEYVMVLVNRDSSIHHLKEEIDETLRKLFPCSSYGQIKSVRKDNGRVLLPDWYPVEPLLKDDEEIVVTYKPLSSDYIQSTDNGYCSRSSQRNSAMNFDTNMFYLKCNSEPQLNQDGIKNDSFLPVSNRAKDNDSSQDILKNVNDASRGSFDAPDIEQFVNGFLQYNETTKVRKRKEEIVENVSQRLESEAPVGTSAGIESEFSFKKLKTDVGGGAIFKADATLPATEAIISHNKITSSLAKGDSCNEIDTMPIFDKIDEVERKSSKKKKNRKKEKREEIFNGSCPLDKSFTIVSNEDTSRNIHRKGIHKKYSKLDSDVDCKQDENSVADTLILCKSSRVFASNRLEEKVDDFQLDNEDSTRAKAEDEKEKKRRSKEKKKQKKKAKKRAKDEEEGKHDATLGTAVSNSSDVKESGIGSDSTVYDIEKRMGALPNKREIIRASFFEKEKKSQGFRLGTQADVMREELSVESDLSMMLESTLKDKGPKERNFDSEDKQSATGCVPERKSVNSNQEEVSGFIQPHANIKAMSNENQARKAVSKDNAENVSENLQDKPTFDYETDTEICQIRSEIHKIVDDVVEESDYQQSLPKEPLTFSLIGGNTRKDCAKSSAEGHQNISPKSNPAVEGCTIKIEGKEAHRESSKKVDGSKREGLGDDKKGESGCCTIEKTAIKKELRNGALTGNNMKIALSADELSLDLYSDTSSMSFSDCEPCNARKSSTKKQNKESSARKSHKPSKREDRPKQQRKRQLEDEEDSTIDRLKERSAKEKEDKNSNMFDISAKVPTVELTDRFEKKKNSNGEGNSKSGKSKRKLDKKSRSSTRKSFAKVKDWLSKMERNEEVPTDTELELEMEKNKDSVFENSELNIGKEESFCVTIAKELCENIDAVNDGGKELNSVTAKVNDNSNCDRKSTGFFDSGTINALDISIEKSSCNPVEDDNSCNGPSPKKQKKVFERPQSKRSSETNSRKDKKIDDFKFDALIEDGGSIVSSKVNRPLLRNTNNASKPLTGFLSQKDQKRFQSKLQKSTRSSAK